MCLINTVSHVDFSNFGEIRKPNWSAKLFIAYSLFRTAGKKMRFMFQAVEPCLTGDSHQSSVFNYMYDITEHILKTHEDN